MQTANRIVHGLWIGPLSRLERLTLCSFLAKGHEFHLWRYEDAPDALPRGVVVRDANEILTREKVFRKRVADGELRLGEGSYATFADLFRTKLLHELGGIWVDMDVLCLRPFDFEQPYVFRAHRLGAVLNVIKCPPGSKLTGEFLDRDERTGQRELDVVRFHSRLHRGDPSSELAELRSRRLDASRIGGRACNPSSTGTPNSIRRGLASTG